MDILDNEEAVIYLINKSGKNLKSNLFVMKRFEAVKFCSDERTKGNDWSLCFSIHKRNWRNELKTFRKNDGRFDDILEELNIIPIFSLDK